VANLSIKYNYRKEKNMEKEIGDNERNVSRPGFTIVYKDFLSNWIKVIGTGPTMLYLQLLSYCYGKKTHAWPSVGTLAENMGVTKNSIRKYRKVLIDYGLIEKMYRRKSANGSYQTNMYQIVRSEDLLYPGQKEGE
jgi:hypothetical protein